MDIRSEIKKEMKTVLENFEVEIKKIRTGRASLTLFEGLKVEYYGDLVPVNQVATLAIAAPDMVTIKPWEGSMLNAIDKAVRNANLGFNPANDGKMVKVFIPPLTEERRKEMVKMVKKYLEERKTTLRNLRRDFRDKVKKLEEEKKISEDEENKLYEDLQKIIDETTKELDTQGAKKEKEILTV